MRCVLSCVLRLRCRAQGRRAVTVAGLPPGVLLGPQEVNTRLMLQSQHGLAAHREHVVEDVRHSAGT